jgi:hypothetical protein
MDEKTLAFIAADRLTHANLKAILLPFIFLKRTDRMRDKRLYLAMTHEEKDSPLIENLRAQKRKNTTRPIKKSRNSRLFQSEKSTAADRRRRIKSTHD